jgi:hypothetical protein
LEKIDENVLDEQQPENKETTQTVSESSEPVLQSQVSTIDILITEPINERDDNNVVPEGYFNLKHEIPKDYVYSRPSSPSTQPSTTIQPTLTNLLSQSMASLNQEAEPAVVVSKSVSKSALDDLSMDFFMGGAIDQSTVPAPDPPTPSAVPSTPTTPSMPSASPSAFTSLTKRPVSIRSHSPGIMPSPLIARARPVPSSRSVSPSVNSESGFAQTPVVNRRSRPNKPSKKVTFFSFFPILKKNKVLAFF